MSTAIRKPDPSQRPRTVLVVDDSLIVCRLAERALEIAGYHVVTASIPEHALDAALEHRPDCIILDVMMPGMDGYQVCAQMRAHPTLAQVPILMHTCKNSKLDVLEAHRAGADGFLVKPVRPQDLCLRVGNAIAKRLGSAAIHSPSIDTPDSPRTPAAEASDAPPQDRAAALVAAALGTFPLSAIIKLAFMKDEICARVAEAIAAALQSDAAAVQALVGRKGAADDASAPRDTASFAAALQTLGTDGVRHRLLETAIARLSARIPHRTVDSRHAHLRHAIAVGECARLLAGPAEVNVMHAAAAGLLHDAGAWILEAALPRETAQVKFLRAKQGLELHAIERIVMQTDHARVGELLAREWRLPEPVCAAIAGQHGQRSDTDGACTPAPLAGVLAAANLLAKALGAGKSGNPCLSEIDGPARAWVMDLIADPDGLAQAIERETADALHRMGLEQVDSDTDQTAPASIAVDVWLPPEEEPSLLELFLSCHDYVPSRIGSLAQRHRDRPLVCRAPPGWESRIISELNALEDPGAMPVVLILAENTADALLTHPLVAVCHEPYDTDVLCSLLRAGV